MWSSSEIKFYHKIAIFNKKENCKSKLTSIYLLNVQWSFLFFLFTIEEKRDRSKKLTLTIEKLYLLVFTSHVIKTKNRNYSMNKVENLGYDR